MSPSLILSEDSSRRMDSHMSSSSKRQRSTTPSDRSHLVPAPPEALHDLICIGFGPASLAIAIALHDALGTTSISPTLSCAHENRPKVAFLERQPQFAWHDGMLLPDARMQISFVKDLATLRDPRSEFTFLNYLHRQNRLVHFLNLGTFFPLRTEYKDYMRWCANWFKDLVHYGQDVLEVVPDTVKDKTGMVGSFALTSVDVLSGQRTRWRARHVVIAVGGKPKIPDAIPQVHPRVIHSSAYLKALPHLLPNPKAHYRIAVVGGGQSAAEIFDDLHSRYPNSSTFLIIRGATLKPSDDSPFVNEVFDPCRVDDVFRQTSDARAASIENDRNTNYGVVRLELLERLYETMYKQRLLQPEEQDWKHQIISNSIVSGVEEVTSRKLLRLCLKGRSWHHSDENCNAQKDLVVDAIVVATGYVRDAHEEILRPVRHLMLGADVPEKRWTVLRNYQVQMDPQKVSPSSGIWLQGCNESTHGLSDTLLSILATRGGEIVESIFGGAGSKHKPGANGFDVNGICKVDGSEPGLPETIG